MGEIMIRLADVKDASILSRLNGTFNKSRLSPDHYAARLSDPNRVDIPILAEMDGIAAGFANLRILHPVFYEEPYSELTELFVIRDYRRRGIGRLMIAYAERLAIQAGAQELIILTDFHNHPALELYRVMGYRHYDISLSKKLGKPTAHGK